MSEWTQVTIGECCEILDNQRIPVNGEERSQRIGTIPYYGANGLQGYIDDYIFDEPLILMAEDGGNFDEFATRPIAYCISGKSWVNNHAHVLRSAQGYDQPFVFYCLEHKDVTPFIKGGTRAKLNQFELRQVTIPSPPLPEQKKIARILTTVDNLIEKTEALIEKYKAIKQGMMHDLFTRGVDQNGKLRPPYEETPHLYKESPLGWIPKEWEAGGIQRYLESTAGLKPGPFGSSLKKEVYTEGGFRVYGQEQVLAGSLKFGDYFISQAKFNELRGFEVHEDDILMTLVGVGTVGKVLVVRSPFHAGIINPRIMRIRIDPQECDIEFLKHLIPAPIIRHQFNRFATGGTMPVLNAAIVRNVIMPIVPIQEQARIAAVLDCHDEQSLALRHSLRKHRQSKTGLMQDLLTGNVRVNVDEAEELTTNV